MANFKQYQLEPSQQESSFVPLPGGSTLKGEFKSPNFAHGQAGWNIDEQGRAEFNDLYIRGFVKTVSVGDDIQSAIDVVYAHGGGVVQLDAGTFYLKTDINLRSGVNMIGAGADITIIDFQDLDFSINIPGTSTDIQSDIRLKDFTIQNSESGYALDIDFTDFLDLDSIKIKDCLYHGLSIKDCQNFRLSRVYTKDNGTGSYGIVIESSSVRATGKFSLIDCISEGNGNGFLISANTNDLNLGSLISCSAISNTDIGFQFDSSSTSALDVTLTGCIALGNGAQGFYVDSASQRVNLVNCFADLNTGDGFEMNSLDCVVMGCYSSSAYDINADIVFVGNRPAGGSTVDPKTRIVLEEDHIQSYLNIHENPRTIRRTMIMQNKCGAAFSQGHVVVIKATASGDQITSTTSVGVSNIFGMADETIAVDAWGRVLVEGYTTKLKVDGTTDIAIGDYLTTSATPGIAQKAAAGNTVFAMALEAYTTDDQAGVIDALIIPIRSI